jgi:hypothetical protein
VVLSSRSGHSCSFPIRSIQRKSRRDPAGMGSAGARLVCTRFGRPWSLVSSPWSLVQSINVRAGRDRQGDIEKSPKEPKCRFVLNHFLIKTYPISPGRTGRPNEANSASHALLAARSRGSFSRQLVFVESNPPFIISSQSLAVRRQRHGPVASAKGLTERSAQRKLSLSAGKVPARTSRT